MKLSKRLETILEALEPCPIMLDVGCDHGYTAIEAVQRKKAEQAIAADVAEGPLRAAAAHIQAAGLSSRIQKLQSDGLRAFLQEANKKIQTKEAALVISGVGGKLLCDILAGKPTNGLRDEKPAETKEAAATLLRGMHQLLLSPQSEPERLRHLLIDELKFAIEREIMCLDEGKYYVILDVRPQKKAEDYAEEAFYTYGKMLCMNPDAVFLSYLRARREKTAKAKEQAEKAAAKAKDNSGSAGRQAEALQEKLRQIDYALRIAERNLPK